MPRSVAPRPDGPGPRPVLVLGLPRSGTTWSARLLGSAEGCRSVMEPDNEKTSAPAIGAKRALGRFPVLAPGRDEPAYRKLWEWAFAGAPRSLALRAADAALRGADEDELESLVARRRSARLALSAMLARRLPAPAVGGRDVRPVVKSVHACLAAEWLAQEFALDVIVVRRHPAGVLASWLELDLPDSDRGLDRHPAVRADRVEGWGVPGPGPGPVARAAWHIGLLSSALEEALLRNPDWHVVEHEAMCVEPHAQLRRLYTDVHMVWSERVEQVLADYDRPGSGFSPQRRRSEVPDSWRTRLGRSEVAELHRTLDGFPHQQWWRTQDPSPPAPARR